MAVGSSGRVSAPSTLTNLPGATRTHEAGGGSGTVFSRADLARDFPLRRPPLPGFSATSAATLPVSGSASTPLVFRGSVPPPGGCQGPEIVPRPRPDGSALEFVSSEVGSLTWFSLGESVGARTSQTIMRQVGGNQPPRGQEPKDQARRQDQGAQAQTPETERPNPRPGPAVGFVRERTFQGIIASHAWPLRAIRSTGGVLPPSGVIGRPGWSLAVFCPDRTSTVACGPSSERRRRQSPAGSANRAREPRLSAGYIRSGKRSGSRRNRPRPDRADRCDELIVARVADEEPPCVEQCGAESTAPPGYNRTTHPPRS